MTTPCCAPGCGAQTTRYGNLCNAHKSRLRRHGHATQAAITESMLRPYKAAFRARQERNRENLAWENLDKRWLAIVDLADDTVARFRSGRPGRLFEYAAANEVVRMAHNAAPSDIAETAVAMFMLLEAEPHRFRSDRAFRVQLVRRTRFVADLDATRTIHPTTGLSKRAYRQLPPRAVEVISEWLTEMFGGPGLYLARLQQREMAQHEHERRTLQQALKELK